MKIFALNTKRTLMNVAKSYKSGKIGDLYIKHKKSFDELSNIMQVRLKIQKLNYNAITERKLFFC